MSNAANIARFLLEEHKPSLGKHLRSMTDEEVSQSILVAVSKRFPGFSPDDLMQGLILAQEIERVDLGYKRQGLA